MRGGGIAHKIKGLTILSFAQPAPTLQVLVAAVDQKDAALPRTLNLQSDAIIGNQCDRNSIEVMDYNGHEIIYLNFKERGVGLNRNNAFMRASADIVLFADDDMRYVAHYPDIVRKAFAAYPDADVILFNLI
ncbi:MAG: glycosyltransferase family 2 protein [Clostridium sp.]|nr:glycosyltransferase family 2 protein [Clostridium sp.]